MGKTGRSLFDWATPQLPDANLIGEYVAGTHWSKTTDLAGCFVAFDIISLGDQPITDRPYLYRYQRLRSLMIGRPRRLRFVDTYRPSDFSNLWSCVMRGAFEGIVFRRWEAPYADGLARMKRILTRDYVVVGVEPGRGKLAGRIGALLIRDPSTGYEGSVAAPPDCPQSVVGRTAELCGNEVFPSGALRHPRFVRWVNCPPPFCYLR
jgi:hypothetical protein